MARAKRCKLTPKKAEGGFRGWFDKLGNQSIGPIIALCSLVASLVALGVTIKRFEADALTKQLESDRAEYEQSMSQIQTNLENRIPLRVRSPLPIFPENDQTLLLEPIKKRYLTLEWADHDRAHHHKYIVQFVCIADIHGGASGSCDPGKLDENTLDNDTRERSNPNPKRKPNYHWTLPGMDKHKVKIDHAGTYAWRVARGEIVAQGEGEHNEEITIFEEWSPYSIFTVFGSIEERVKVTKQVLIGTIEGSAIQENEGGNKDGRGWDSKKNEEAEKQKDVVSKEKQLVHSIQEVYFDRLLKQVEEQTHKEEHKKQRKQYRQYPTYEALVEAVARGEVDYAIGEITRAKYREKKGVYFTRGYNDAMPSFVSKSREMQTPKAGDSIGVEVGSISERALAHLTISQKFVVAKELTLDALVDDLRSGSVRFIFSERALRDEEDKEFSHVRASYHELDAFYAREIGDSVVHAIVTADRDLCNTLEKIVDKNPTDIANNSEPGCVDSSNR